MKPVLQDPESAGVDPVYWVFKEVTEDRWENVTVIAPGRLGQEYPKTFGHYHPADAPDETYHLIEGAGVLQLQKKHLDKQGGLDLTQVDEVVFIKAEPGMEIVIPQEWGHSWSNVGEGPLISFDDWRSGHTPADYEPIEHQQGLAYYLVEEDSQVRTIPNPKYQNLPEPQWLTPEEFKRKNY